MQKSIYKKVKFNVSMHGRNAGAIEEVKCDSKGTVLDVLIRRRFADNDGSVEFVKEEKEVVSNLAEKTDNSFEEKSFYKTNKSGNKGKNK